MKAWTELTETWLQTPFTEIDAGILEKNVTLYQRMCHQAIKGLPSNPVAKRLKAREIMVQIFRGGIGEIPLLESLARKGKSVAYALESRKEMLHASNLPRQRLRFKCRKKMSNNII